MPKQMRAEDVKIPPEIARMLKGLDGNFEASRKQLASLKKVGLDTKELEDKLEWAAAARKMLLEDFT